MEELIFGLTLEDIFKIFTITIIAILGIMMFIFMLFAIREYKDSDYTKWEDDDFS